MPEPIVYVDRSQIRDGALEALRPLMTELAEHVEANEPRLIAYTIHVNEAGSQMSVMHMHADAASLAFHMEVAGPLFPKFGEFIDLMSIDIYGDPGEELLAQLRAKASLLGSGTVTVHRLQAGFTRFGAR